MKNTCKTISYTKTRKRLLINTGVSVLLGESLMIAPFMPLWNSLIDGFGNHNPSKGRYTGIRPR